MGSIYNPHTVYLQVFKKKKHCDRAVGGESCNRNVTHTVGRLWLCGYQELARCSEVVRHTHTREHEHMHMHTNS